ncbi:hypothetical protein PspS04_00800 [Pseudomonas sp. S04]|uniref:hypothetical protein n=1 Tax=unclassified Pseudomonas TaxID=196821 RepID=UPI00131F6A48|nr:MULTISPECIES: hypothetical protein [unclassified Pseudomonas]QHC98977.1 hypothetical protein PspS04_00800 [Pseudomonas sp. S04]QHF31464.1 hypothetical protein PspS19_00800 [Pseudomonas sp. S19]
MHKYVSVIARTLEHTFMASLCLFVPVYLFFWFTQTVTFAKSYSLCVTLVIALAYAFVQVSRSINIASYRSIDEYRKHSNDKIIAGVFSGVALTGVLAYTAYDVDQTQQEWADRQARIATRANQETSCREIGVQYGRASAKGLKAESVALRDDVVIPERCRNQATTKEGIKIGLNQGLAR